MTENDTTQELDALREQVGTLRAQLVRSAITAAAGGRFTPGLVEAIDTSKFLTEAGEVDQDAVAALVGTVAGPTPRAPEAGFSAFPWAKSESLSGLAGHVRAAVKSAEVSGEWRASGLPAPNSPEAAAVLPQFARPTSSSQVALNSPAIEEAVARAVGIGTNPL